MLSPVGYSKKKGKRAGSFDWEEGSEKCEKIISLLPRKRGPSSCREGLTGVQKSGNLSGRKRNLSTDGKKSP